MRASRAKDWSKVEFCELTLHGKQDVQRKRADVILHEALKHRFSDPETYLILYNTATQMYDQLDNLNQEVV